jgi:hypothetical protein
MKIENNKVVNHRGDVMAEKVYGKWESKYPDVLTFISVELNKTSTTKSSKKINSKKEMK